MNIWKILLVCLALAFASCQTGQQINLSQKSDPTLISVTAVDKSTMGNMRVVSVSKHKRHNILLVNHSNRRYLLSQSSDGETSNTIAALRYVDRDKVFSRNTSVVILEDETMGKMAALLQSRRFYEFATPCSLEEIRQPHWPPRDAILVEKGKRLYALIRPERLFGEAGIPSKEGDIYRIVKYNILHAPGHHPLQVQNNVNSQAIFSRK